MKDYEVGEEFQFGKIRIRVEESTDKLDVCNGCIFKQYSVHACDIVESFTGSCMSGYREDGKSVVFVKIEEDV